MKFQLFFPLSSWRSKRSWCLDKLVSMMLACFGVCLFVCTAVAEGALFGLLRPWLPRAAYGAIFCFSSLTLAALLWNRPRCFPRRPLFGASAATLRV